MLRSAKPRLSWERRLHRMADKVNVFWVIGITAFLIFVMWIIGKYDLHLWIIGFFTSSSRPRLTEKDFFWLIVLFLAIYQIDATTIRVVGALGTVIESLEQRISDLEWVINNQQKKIEGMDTFLRHNLTQQKPNMYIPKK